MGEAHLCPLCRVRAADGRWRPFCSERCRNEDLARWVEGRYRIASEPIHTTDIETDTDS